MCFYCGSKETIKSGRKGCRQQYKCKCCGRRFVGGRRLDDEQIRTAYIEGKQTLSQLAVRYGVNKSTIWRRLRGMRHVRVISRHKDVVINMDTTYWGRSFGLMVIKDTFRNKIIWYKFVRSETVADYMEGISWLQEHGFTIHGVVCDGMRGLFAALHPYPVQMCQFHQMMTVRRYLTARPELPAARELLELTRRITQTDREGFTAGLDLWQQRWKEFLRERTHDRRSGRSTYTHPRVRSAYLSLRRNMRWLWTYQDYPQLHMPNTNNAIEGVFTDIKTKLRVHSGITKMRRMALIQEYIARHY